MNGSVHIGTCAWGFDEWHGVFYPEHLPATERLPHYARIFRAVEADSTFYHVPELRVVRHWAAATPDDFVFCCKVPREITHERRLRDCRALVEGFAHAMAPLGAKLGPFLVQLPPSFAPGRDEEALRDFIRDLPHGYRFAVEFRHAGWHLPRIVHLLESHGVCWVWADVAPLESMAEAPFHAMPRTAPFLYVRLLGDLGTKYRPDGSRIHVYRELQWPRDRVLDSWATRVRGELATADHVYLFSNNHYEGYSPETCRRIGRELGVEIELPRAVVPVEAQMKLW